MVVLWPVLSRAQKIPYNGPEYNENIAYVNSRMEDLNMGILFNYPKPSAKLSDFGDKLIILCFWYTKCGACISQFPLEDSLQKIFSKDVQFIPVTFDQPDSAINFLKKWHKENNRKIELPYIIGDTVFTELFPNVYFPHYVWLGKERRIIAHTSQQLLTEEYITAVLKAIYPEKTSVRATSTLPHSDQRNSGGASSQNSLSIKNQENE